MHGLSASNIVRDVLVGMEKANASDCIVLTDSRPYYKVYGEMQEVPHVGHITYNDLLGFFRTGLNESMLLQVKSGFQQLNTGYTIDSKQEGVRLRFRFNFSAFAGNTKRVRLVARLLPLQPPLPGDLDLPQEIVDETMRAPFGIGFVGGATGSGKSTTLAALIHNISREKPKHISTLEAPIEYVYDYVKTKVPVVQVEVGEGANIKSFSTGVEEAMRQAPDYLLIGEVRDAGTAEGVIQFAETGHYALSTIHISSAASLFDRFSVFYAPDLRDAVIRKLVSQISFVLVQSLLPKVGGGRVAVREYLLFDNQMKLELLQLSAPGIRERITQWMRERGTDFRTHLDKLVSEGAIEQQTRERFLYVIGEK